MQNVNQRGDLMTVAPADGVIRGGNDSFGDAGTKTGFDNPVLEGRTVGPDDTNSMGSITGDTKSDSMFDRNPRMDSDPDSGPAGTNTPTPVQSSAMSGTDSDPEFQTYPDASSGSK